MKEEGLKNLVTIVIPTHYRHHLLGRILDYYKDCGIRILVADSSLDEFKEKDKFECEYFHYPDVPYVKKMIDIVRKIKTPYFVFCADDDFILVSSILKCVKFLNDSPEYSVAEGNYVRFNESTVSVSVFPWEINSITDFSDTNVYRRAYLLFSQNVICYYGVQRLCTFKDLISLVELYDINYSNVYERLLHFCSAISGKYKLLSCLYGVRDGRAHPGAILSKWQSGEDDKFKAAVIQYLSHKHNMQEDAAKKFFVDMWLARDSNKNFNRPKWRRIVRFILPERINEIKLRLLGIRMRWSMREKLGYPFGGDSEAKREWDIIKAQIKKFKK
jgi:glycosyltransferase domain-containing protein